MNATSLDITHAPGPLSPEAQGVLSSALALCDDSAIDVGNAEQAVDAAGELTVIKGAMKRVAECRKSFTRPLDELKQRWTQFFEPTIIRLEGREEQYKKALTAFEYAERERLRLEREKAEAAARAEQERLQKAAEAKAKREEKKGNLDAAQDLRDSVPTVIAAKPTEEAVKLPGFAVREIWRGECWDKRALLRAILDGQAPPDLVDINQTALNKLAAGLKGVFNVPGCRAYTVTSASSRSV